MKSVESLQDLDDMIDLEKHNVAEEFLLESWVDAASEGIETEIIARSAILMALRRALAECGEATARELADEIPGLFENGKLQADRALH
ncbi:MAG: hypothetical protein AAGH82_07805 [Pseudomonadota bacterium]